MPAPAWLRWLDFELVRAGRRARTGAAGLGPGIITGVADDDPSGISTYTIAGASYGYGLLWMSLVTLPMTFAVQSICARIGIVTGKGLAQVIAERQGRGWLGIVVGLLLVANVVNIAADVGAIASALELLSPVPGIWWVVPVGVFVALVEVALPYAQFARFLKILTLVIFSYVVGAFVAGPNWRETVRGTLLPDFQFDREFIGVVVAILGTTISPYLFFWQASEEVEEERLHGIDLSGGAQDEAHKLVRAASLDVGLGMVMANVGFYFVVLTAAATLYSAGVRDIETAADAAEALRPLAGDAATLLFALGILGTGLLAIPVLAGSTAYAVSELFGWREGLSYTFPRAPQFYAVIAVATLIGVLIVFSPIPPFRALYIAAIVNGVLAPIILTFVMLAAGSRETMHGMPASGLLLTAGWVTTFAMGCAAVVLPLALQ